MSRGEDDAGGDEGGPALEGLHSPLLPEDGTHVRPLPHLGLVLAEALDPRTEAVDIPPPAATHVLHLKK